ncbi:hypothetical protein RMSM_07097 [Rhodopirellula maiorica SM1]|uniref:Uncharacterized protein n=1 Tax=Rhodopirellula maiorica SM1 TaxID=1265738 RepID=M5RA96_9BACT|nr:hypothetical protein RMSM_07097 [Rhodopirellula maiorica SM1]
MPEPGASVPRENAAKPAWHELCLDHLTLLDRSSRLFGAIESASPIQ